MKKSVLRMTYLCSILSSLILLPTTSFAIDLFNTESGVLVIPEVDVNGDTFYDNVVLKLDFATGRFEVISAETKPETISATPLDTMEDQNIKMDFMGCTRSGRNEITCHLKLTSLGGFDREVSVFVGSGHIYKTYLYDDLGNTYESFEGTVGNLQSEGKITLTLVAGVPTLAKFKFNNISPNANSLSLFKPAFTLFSGAGDDFYGDFRSIDF